ncbi:MAG: OmpA family protein [Fuerstiella sp.]|jgi:chemotaxis protein MotB|nr:OmpA family protein [Fuerstiella sp.]MCP4507526.1 OmpA family protein [Fuerstiella sp.]MDG2128467.1 OmpA family protein [Fuerstiella sp.]
MPLQNSSLSILLLAVASCLSTGCCCLPGHGAAHEHLTASQLRSQELFAENENLLTAQNALNQTVAGLELNNQMLTQQLNQNTNQLATANSRIDNLLAERSQLKDRYVARLADASEDPMSLGGGSTIPGFNYDPLTGLNKFPEDVQFDLGSAQLRSEALSVLKQFVSLVNAPDAAGMRVLVVGHTDDQRIAVGGSTAAEHPTNWHLSTDRADQVISELEILGISPERMAAMGYSRFQPLETGIDESSRQRNRRVELYIVPESTNVAAWDPARSLN